MSADAPREEQSRSLSVVRVLAPVLKALGVLGVEKLEIAAKAKMYRGPKAS